MNAVTECAHQLLYYLHQEGSRASNEKLRDKLSQLNAKSCSDDFKIYPMSVLSTEKTIYLLSRIGGEKSLLAISSNESRIILPPDISESSEITGNNIAGKLHLCRCSNVNALFLQKQFTHLCPTVNPGLPAFGAGDRLGLSTPGHVRALSSNGLFPIFAQQSIREMKRTARTPGDVISSAVWGIMQEGFSGKWGSDADHLKTISDIEYVCGFPWTTYTLDPSDEIVDVETFGDDELRARFMDLPWNKLNIKPDDFITCYTGMKKPLSDNSGHNSTELVFSEKTVVKCAVKYLTGIARCVDLVGAIESRVRDEYDLEISFDETDTATTPLEHFFIASELERLDVPVTGLALRFPGAFEKGIDYKEDISEFEKAFAVHAAIRKEFDRYRLSIHSGSDKFSVYPIMTKYAGENLHVKTAGTTYLEALKIVASNDEALFKELLEFSTGRYNNDKFSYHVSADIDNVKNWNEMKCNDYAALLDDDNYRQIFHVTFGSVLTSGPEHDFRSRILEVLSRFEEQYYSILEKHLTKHLEHLGWHRT